MNDPKFHPQYGAKKKEKIRPTGVLTVPQPCPCPWKQGRRDGRCRLCNGTHTVPAGTWVRVMRKKRAPMKDQATKKWSLRECLRVEIFEGVFVDALVEHVRIIAPTS